VKHWTKILFIFSFFTLFFPVKNLDAKSGCCSGHGGVNCSAGAQSNGNVICNDGWRGSSCSYSGMVMCGGSSGSTTTVKTVQPTSVPTRLPTKDPTKTPTTIPTNIPTNTPVSTLTLTPSPFPTETLTLTPTIEPTITPSPIKVLGTTTESKESTSSDNPLGNLAIFAWVVYGIVKLVKKIKNKKSL
jgi:hypothetical protein